MEAPGNIPRSWETSRTTNLEQSWRFCAPPTNTNRPSSYFILLFVMTVPFRAPDDPSLRKGWQLVRNRKSGIRINTPQPTSRSDDSYPVQPVLALRTVHENSLGAGYDGELFGNVTMANAV